MTNAEKFAKNTMKAKREDLFYDKKKDRYLLPVFYDPITFMEVCDIYTKTYSGGFEYTGSALLNTQEFTQIVESEAKEDAEIR